MVVSENGLVVLTKEYVLVRGRIKGIPVVTVNALQHCVQNRGHVYLFDV